MESVLKCDRCRRGWRHTLAVDILTDVSLDKSTKEKFIDSFEDEKEENYIKILASNFAHDKNKKHIIIRELTGQKLAELSLKSKITATIILSANDDVASDLCAILLHVARNNSCRTSAAEILKHLCSHYTKDQECFDRLKKALTDAMPKVLTKLLSYGSTVELETGIEADNNRFSAPDIDIETGRAAQDSTSKDISSPGELKCNQDEDRKLKEALLSLCLMVSEILTTEDPDLARQLDEIAASVCFDTVIPVTTFASIMKDAQELLNKKKQAQDSEIVPAS
ncbi:uncharacterized protein LOC112268933 [Brachypodium distachyon]|nr:uncharacterized protein LOC112268933 [Brachypodium distachyon]XP_024310987.1 uncharacterized protein LOC112268933 [Brachypodium distachyon]|eukprot:XP_024310986.1 uncharacterized protein LOC112268933 [Brachypodium distachyon]